MNLATIWQKAMDKDWAIEFDRRAYNPRNPAHQDIWFQYALHNYQHLLNCSIICKNGQSFRPRYFKLYPTVMMRLFQIKDKLVKAGKVGEDFKFAMNRLYDPPMCQINVGNGWAIDYDDMPDRRGHYTGKSFDVSRGLLAQDTGMDFEKELVPLFAEHGLVRTYSASWHFSLEE